MRAVKHLTVRNVIIAFFAMQIIGAAMLPGAVRTMNAVPSAGGTFQHVSGDKSPQLNSNLTRQQWQPKRPPVVKVQDLPDTAALRYGENAFVDLGWRYAGEAGGEWVGYIGSDSEYLPLDDAQIDGILKEAQLKALPPPPITPRAVKPFGDQKPAKPQTRSQDGSTWVFILLAAAAGLYVRYRISQATVDAVDRVAGFAKRAFGSVMDRQKATGAMAARTGAVPVSTTPRTVTVQPRRSTVVRPSRIPFLTGG